VCLCKCVYDSLLSFVLSLNDISVVSDKRGCTIQCKLLESLIRDHILSYLLENELEEMILDC